MLDEFEVMQKYWDFLEDKGYTVLYLGLFGSQNYNMQTKNSDVDARAVVVLSTKDLFMNKKTSTVYELEEGQLDVKDVRTYMEVLKKGNPSFLEPLFSRWYLGNDDFRELCQQVPMNPQAALGSFYHKSNRVFKEPTTAKDLAVFHELGYNPKDLHHTYRFLLLAQASVLYSLTHPYLEYSRASNKDGKLLKEFKEGVLYNLEFLKNSVEDWKKCANALNTQTDWSTLPYAKFLKNKSDDLLNDVWELVSELYY